MAKKYAMVGINDEQDTCLCCGKAGLKRVVWLVPLDQDGNRDGNAEHYGTTCAARILGYSYPTSAGTKRKVELAAIKETENTIARKIQQLREKYCLIILSSAPHGRFYILKEHDDPYFNGTMNLKDCLEALREAFPIMRYNDGKMTREQALVFAMRQP